MLLNETLLNDCEEFFDLIANEEQNVKLDKAVDSLRVFLERDIDGWTNHSEHVLARAVQCRMMEIWGLISKAEKAGHSELKEYYDQILAVVEDVSEFETDDVEDEP
jgi:hypothetical protein